MKILLIYDDLGFADYYNIPQNVYFFHKKGLKNSLALYLLTFDFNH